MTAVFHMPLARVEHPHGVFMEEFTENIQTTHFHHPSFSQHPTTAPAGIRDIKLSQLRKSYTLPRVSSMHELPLNAGFTEELGNFY